MKKIVLSALLTLGLMGSAQAAFYDDSSQYQAMEHRMDMSVYLDRHSLKAEEKENSGKLDVALALLSVSRKGEPSIEKTWFTLHFDEKKHTAYYTVEGAAPVDAAGQAQAVVPTEGAGRMRRGIVKGTNMYYLANACYRHFRGTDFYTED
jgi:hypothetical protein